MTYQLKIYHFFVFPFRSKSLSTFEVCHALDRNRDDNLDYDDDIADPDFALKEVLEDNRAAVALWLGKMVAAVPRPRKRLKRRRMMASRRRSVSIWSPLSRGMMGIQIGIQVTKHLNF